MINFEKQTWYNKNDPNNQDKRIPISAAHLNRIEDAVSAAVSHVNDMTKHWWRRSKIVDKIIEYVTGKSLRFNFFTSKTSAIDIYYSDSVNIKTDSYTGEYYFELNEPTAWNVSYNGHGTNYTTTLTKKFIIVSSNVENQASSTTPYYAFTTTTKNGGILYYCSGSSYAQEWQEATLGGSRTIYGLSLGNLYTTQIRDVYGEEEYVSALSRDAYSEGWNETELMKYEYLGIPFENSREPFGMISGWYIGDGNAPRVIDISHKPKLVLINGSFYAADYGDGREILRDNGFAVDTQNSIAVKYNYIAFY